MKFIKKIFSFEPLIIWFRYFLTVNIKTIIANFFVPLSVCIILGCCCKKTIEYSELDIFTMSSILLGFCSSILIMLFTAGGKNIEKLKMSSLNRSKITLYQALIYKFAFLTINLVVLLFIAVLARFIDFESNLYYKLYVIFILLNTILTLIEALTNVIFCFINNREVDS